MNLKLYRQAKREFEKAFAGYAKLMHKYTGIVYEPPQLYYSESLAKKGLQQVQTKYYNREAGKVRKRIEKDKKRNGG